MARSTVFVGVEVIDYNGDTLGDSVLVENGVIAGVGGESRFKGVKRVNVDGYITPGFVDAHLHLEGIGLALETVDLRGSRSPEDLARRLARSKGPVALGRGWDQEGFDRPGVMPDRRVLDEAIPDRPALAVRICGHMAVANTAALAATKPWERFPGLVDRERGLLYEDAAYYVLERLRDWLDPMALVERALAEMVKHGVYGASSMACSSREMSALEDLESRGLLRAAIACYAARGSMGEVGRGGSLWRVVGLKLFADGSLGARTARLSRDYSDAPGVRGKLLLASREIVALARPLVEKGFRVAVHAIGDEALAHVAEAFERLGGGGRLRVEHASVAGDREVAALGDLGVWVVVQPRFRVSDWWIDRRLGDRLWMAYRFRSLLAAGARLALSTDSPVEPIDPAETLRAAAGLCSQPSCRGEESLRPREALEAYTLRAAHASGGPVARLGRVEKGAPAALALATGDPRSLKDLKSLSIKGLTGGLQPAITR